MKSTKFIKLPISKKQINQTLTCVNKDGKMAVGLIHQSRLDYSFTCITEINGNKSYMYDVEFYLIEVEDKASEMLDLLKDISSALEKMWNENDSNIVFDLIDAESIDILIKEASK